MSKEIQPKDQLFRLPLVCSKSVLNEDLSSKFVIESKVLKTDLEIIEVKPDSEKNSYRRLFIAFDIEQNLVRFFKFHQLERDRLSSWVVSLDFGFRYEFEQSINGFLDNCSIYYSDFETLNLVKQELDIIYRMQNSTKFYFAGNSMTHNRLCEVFFGTYTDQLGRNVMIELHLQRILKSGSVTHVPISIRKVFESYIYVR